MKRLLCLLLICVTVQADEHEVAAMLAKAARTGDVKTMENLLSAGVSADLADGSGHAPLYYAAAFDQTKTVELLLAHHADPNTPVGTRSIEPPAPATALQYAAELGNRRIASELLEAGARVDGPGPTGRTALHYALGHLDVLQMLLEKGANANARDRDGSSALDEAVWFGLVDAAAILLAHGAGLNEAEPKTGATPINEAAYKGQTKMVAYLLRFAPDLTIADKRGYGPLENAARLGKEDAAVLLVDRSSSALLPRVIDLAMAKNEPRLAGALLQRGVAVNNNALEDAALKGFDGIVETLIAHDADVNNVNQDSGSTALYSAAAFGKTGVVKVLLTHGANPNLCGTKGKSPLQAAIENGFSEAAALIEAAGGQKTCKAS